MAKSLFSGAKKSAKEETPAKKKTKGTILSLPIEMVPFEDPDTGKTIQVNQHQALHDAVHDVIANGAMADAAKSKIKAAGGVVMPTATDLLARVWAKNGVPPETPVSIVAQGGETLTYISQDRSGKNGLDEKQVEDLSTLLGSAVVQGDDTHEGLVTEIDKFRPHRDRARRDADR